MKTAIVTDFLVQAGGAESTTRALADCYLEADIYTLFAKDEIKQKYFPHRSVIQHPKMKSFFRKKLYRKLVPFYPTYIEDFDFSEYDLVISSSYLFAKGLIPPINGVHIAYIHTPIRQAWTHYHRYLNRENDIGRLSRWLLRYTMNYLRIWDVNSTRRVDHFIANSTNIQQRIKKIYRRDATVIHPPVRVQEYAAAAPKNRDDYFISVGRLVPYKRIDLLVETFNHWPDKKLLIVGTGNDLKRLKNLTRSANIHFLGYVNEEKKKELMANAQAFLFAAEEDFGISPVEAMALGTPVIAFKKGGALDYIQPGVNGCFFNQQNAASLTEAINRFEEEAFESAQISKSVSSFDEKHFREQITSFINDCLHNITPP